MNVILFNPDEMRAESLGCYGHPVARTPHLDRLAAEGVRFEQCHVQHTVCSPSRCSFMTGLYPHVNGHRTLWHLLRPHEPNLLRYAKDAGYEVVWWGKNDLLAPESFPLCTTAVNQGIPAGPAFQRPGRNPYPLGDPRYYSFLYEPPVGPPEAHPDARAMQAALNYLESRPSKPFLMYLPLVFPHCPYQAPEPWHSLIHPDAVPPLRPPAPEGKPDYVRLIRRNRRLDELDDAFLRRIQAVYLGMIGFSDSLLGRLLQTLERTGLDRDTVIVAFSDHGDWAGDFGLVEKWPSALDDCLTRIPLIIRAPGGRAGHVVREPVEAFDIMATVLELIGTPARHTHFARSLVPQLQGAPGDPTRAAFAEGGYDPHEPNCFESWDGRPAFAHTPEAIYYPKILQQGVNPESVCRTAMVRTLDHKLVYRSAGQSELYDLRADPRELRNRYADPACTAARSTLERRLLDWYLHTADTVPLDDNPRGFGR